MKKISLISLSFLAIILAATPSCGRSNESNRRTIAVSIEPQRWILEKLAGDEFDIVTVLENGANPETFDPSFSARLQADRAKVYFSTGCFPFEEILGRSLGKAVKVVNTSTGIDFVYGTHSHGSSEEEYAEADPHIWTSARNAAVMACTMSKALSELNPGRAEVYARRLSVLTSMLDSLDHAIADKLTSAPTGTFAVWHPSLSYFARDYGLEQLAVGQESKEMSAGRVRQMIDEAISDSVRVFFFQREYDSRQAESINQAIGSRLVVINPLDYDLPGQLTLISDEIARP